MKYYNCKVSYERQDVETGIRKVTENYLVDAVSFTEAEERITREIIPYASSGGIEVVNIRPMRLLEIIQDSKLGGDRYFKAKVTETILDADTGMEKRVSQAILVQAERFAVAFSLLADFLGKSISDWDILAITELDILGVYKYDAPSEEGAQ